MATISKSLAHAVTAYVVVFEAGNIGALEVATPEPLLPRTIALLRQS